MSRRVSVRGVSARVDWTFTGAPRHLMKCTSAAILCLALTQPASGQTVTTAALQDLAVNLILAESLSSLKLKGAGQKIPFKLSPPPSGLTVQGTQLGGGAVTLPVTLTVNGWTIKSGETPWVEDQDYKVFNDDPANGARSFVFKTTSFHWTSSTTTFPSTPVTVEIRVTLSAGTPPTQVGKTISRNLNVPRVPIPKILALYRHPQFESSRSGVRGYLLLLVPSNSPLVGQTAVRTFLNDLNGALSNLSFVTSFAGSAARIALFSARTPAGFPDIQFRYGGQNDLDEVVMRNITGGQDVTANDSISSIMFIAHKGYKSYFFNDQNYATGEGAFTLTAGEGLGMVVEVKSLSSSYPSTSPSGLLQRVKKDNDGNFNNSITSIKFSN